MREVFVVSAARTPIGRFGGALKDKTPPELAAHAMRAALERAGLSGSELDFYVFGNVLRGGHGQLVPRQAALMAGISHEVDGYAIDMVCSSGMMAVMSAASAVRAGEAELVLAGGVESMSQAGFSLSHRARWGYKFLLGAPEELKDLLLYDGLTDPLTGEPMGLEAERVIELEGFSREELDEVAYLSHRRAAEATEQGYFKNEIAPLSVKTKKGEVVLEADEGIRFDTSLEKLAALKPAFKKDGKLTAGNSSQISDGAAALVLASEKAVKEYGLKPFARLLAGTSYGVESWRFVEAPVHATKKLLKRLGLKIDDVDYFENNEAFAVNTLLFEKYLGVSRERLNVFGGAIALGHPIGASGARIVVTLLNVLATKGGRRGLATLCHGTGGATALMLELL